MPRVNDPAGMRRRIVAAAGGEFFRRGYRAGSLNGVVAAAGVTKGALFHHFAGKQGLLEAWLDEEVVPALRRHWIEPLAALDDPVAGLRRLLEAELVRVEAGGSEGALRHGCRLANLAADAAGVDEVVRVRLAALYAEWRDAVAAALARGKAAGKVHPQVVADDEAAFLVAALAGIATTAKPARDAGLWRAAFRAAAAYLDTLRAPEQPPQ